MVSLKIEEIQDRFEDDLSERYDEISVPHSAIVGQNRKTVSIELDHDFYEHMKKIYPKKLAKRIAGLHALYFRKKSLEDVKILVTETGEIRIRSLV